MDCPTATALLHDLRRRRLEAPQRDLVVQHLRACETCRREDEMEALIDRLLLERLSTERASPQLRSRIEAMAARPPVVRLEVASGDRDPGAAPARRARAPLRRAVPALAAAVVLIASGVVLGRLVARPGESAAADLAGEAIADHLRVLAAAHPYDVGSGNSHEVKPWFEGHLDFAPNVPADSGDLRLRGGAVGYFLDRKAAVISYGLRRHAVTLLAFPANGLAWGREDRTLNGVPVRTTTSRGFHAALWRHGDIGYAAVSDVDAQEFWKVAGQLARATGG